MASAKAARAGTSPRGKIEFIDLKAQRRRLGKRIDQAVSRVIEHGAYILGPEVAELEKRLAAYAGVKHAISCASGTDALLMPLMAWGIGPGHAVFVPSFTFAATAEVVALAGATPVFVDVRQDTFNIDPDSLVTAIATARSTGLAPRAVIPVDLFGLLAPYDAIADIARRGGLLVLEDAAQSFGATFNTRRACAFGTAAGTSFFPAKPLGCYGDGGAIFTDDDELAHKLRSIRVHGQGSNKYDNVAIGLNGRLDTIQAAILLEKLAVFDDELAQRERIARRYTEGLAGAVATPCVPIGHVSAWAQYTVVVEGRDALAAALKATGIPTAIYYPKPLHRQPAYERYPRATSGLAVSERLADTVLSLPMHPYLDEVTQDHIVGSVRAARR